jgi:hypothetical protein
VMLEMAIEWKGAQGAAFAMLGSSIIAVVGFFIAMLNLKQFRLEVVPEEEATFAPPPER